MPSRTILVITSQKGIQLFEADGSVMLYWYALGEVNQGDGKMPLTMLTMLTMLRAEQVLFILSAMFAMKNDYLKSRKCPA